MTAYEYHPPGAPLNGRDLERPDVPFLPLAEAAAFEEERRAAGASPADARASSFAPTDAARAEQGTEEAEADVSLETFEQGDAHELEYEEQEAGLPPARGGVSSLAIQASKQWDATDRPRDWQGRVYGLVVHTTGGGLPASARDQRVYHTVRAVSYYTANSSHGCHYVNGWRGVEGGDLLQIANEREQANGVGVTNPKDPGKDQRRSIDLGRFEADLPAVVVRLWRRRWPRYRHSLELLPGTRSANACYVHVECVPCVYHYDKRLTVDAEPLRAGLRFTRAQHDAIAQLAIDVATRNGWSHEDRWWRTPRLLGHEDLTPISRHDPRGAWDPGYLRESPYFDWDYVYDVIERARAGAPMPASAHPPDTTGPAAIFSALGELQQRFRQLVAAGQEALAVAAAVQRGVADPNVLANLVFAARHPELGGRPIRPDERGLAEEWLRIRDTIVRPALAAVQPLAATAP